MTFRFSSSHSFLQRASTRTKACTERPPEVVMAAILGMIRAKAASQSFTGASSDSRTIHLQANTDSSERRDIFPRRGFGRDFPSTGWARNQMPSGPEVGIRSVGQIAWPWLLYSEKTTTLSPAGALYRRARNSSAETVAGSTSERFANQSRSTLSARSPARRERALTSKILFSGGLDWRT